MLRKIKTERLQFLKILNSNNLVLSKFTEDSVDLILSTMQLDLQKFPEYPEVLDFITCSSNSSLATEQGTTRTTIKEKQGKKIPTYPCLTFF